MSQEDFKRKLTAILSADAVGYSRLMGEDEESTVRTLNKYKELIYNFVNKNNGRVIDSPGDNVLAEFASVVEAVMCAVQAQKDLKEQNKELPSSRKMEFRVGINIGDVIQDGERIYGDGVNVAARIESLADPGGICISRTAYDQVERKINIKYDYLGEHEVKNIKKPVRVYKVLMDNIASDIFEKAQSEGKLSTESKSPTHPEKSSIAVLPFLNLSSDPEQEFFVDGLSEEILNSLCQIQNLNVTGRTSSFSFKGSDKTIQEIAGVLGVDHVLEGSVRKAGIRLRITAQLVRASDSFHLWSKTYDRELNVNEIFEVQEDIATAVANELKVTFGIDRSHRQLGSTNNMKAYELYLIAKGLNLQDATIDSYERQLKLIDEAIALDPEFALAWALKGITHYQFATSSSVHRVSFDLDAGRTAALKAIQLEPNLGQAYLTLGSAYSTKCEFIEAELTYRKGMELTTESIDFFDYGLIFHYCHVGHFGKSRDLIVKMRKTNPLKKHMRALFMAIQGSLGNMKEAEEEYSRCKTIFGDQWSSGDLFIIPLRLGSKDNISIDDIPAPYPKRKGFGHVYSIVREKIASPDEGLKELRRLYSNADELLIMDFYDISLSAAYFGDLEFSMEALEKGTKAYMAGLPFCWFPVMKKVRQLPRFKEFIREMGIVDYWKRFGWSDFCRPIDGDDFVCE